MKRYTVTLFVLLICPVAFAGRGRLKSMAERSRERPRMEFNPSRAFPMRHHRSATCVGVLRSQLFLGTGFESVISLARSVHRADYPGGIDLSIGTATQE